jgi:hypothetical protein
VNNPHASTTTNSAVSPGRGSSALPGAVLRANLPEPEKKKPTAKPEEG